MSSIVHFVLPTFLTMPKFYSGRINQSLISVTMNLSRNVHMSLLEVRHSDTQFMLWA